MVETRIIGQRPVNEHDHRCHTVDPDDGWECPEDPAMVYIHEVTSGRARGHRFEVPLCQGCADDREGQDEVAE